MSNRMFTLTVNAIEVLDKVPKRSRSKFVSDAIASYSKKKDVFNNYLIVDNKKSIQTISKTDKSTTSIKNPQIDSKINKKKIKIDDGY